MGNQIGFSEAEAKYFGNIVEQMMRAKEGRRKVKKEKKPAKMKRAELLKRLLAFMDIVMGVLDLPADEHWVPPYAETKALLEELRRVVK